MLEKDTRHTRASRKTKPKTGTRHSYHSVKGGGPNLRKTDQLRPVFSVCVIEYTASYILMSRSMPGESGITIRTATLGDFVSNCTD